jgi:hypothetical protein
MTTLSYKKLTDRWDALPLPLREELYSEAGSSFLWSTCEAEHIPDNKIYDIARIVGYVLMGFLRPEDMAGEIRDTTGIDLRIATPIANAVNQRIFVPLRPQIDKVYNLTTDATGAAPKMLEEIRPAPKTQSSVSVPVPAKFSPIPAPLPQQAANKVSPVAPPRPGEKIPTQRPVVLQVESASRPILNAPNFRVPTIAEDAMGTKKASVPLPVKPAVVEFGGGAGTPRATTPQNPVAATKIPLSIKPSSPDPMRTVTEITPGALKNFVPMPATPPRPSFAPTTQINIPSSVAPKTSAASAPKPPAPEIPLPRPTNQSGR